MAHKNSASSTNSPVEVYSSDQPITSWNQADQHTDLIPVYLLRFSSANTKRAYTNDLTDFFGTSTVSLTEARQVDFVQVNEYLSTLDQEGLRPATLQRRTAALRGFFSWLMALGLIDNNPADRHLVRKSPRANRRDRHVTVLTSEQAYQLLSQGIDDSKESAVRDRTLLSVLLHCVLRRSEAQSMDFVHLRRAGEYWVLDLPHTKGGADQYVKVPDHVAEELFFLRGHYGVSEGPVWFSLSNNSYKKRLSSTSIYTVVRSAAQRAGIQGAVGAHTLRHTGCTLAIESGASLQQVQSHARHKNLETTMMYVHHRDRLRDSAADYITLNAPPSSTSPSDATES